MTDATVGSANINLRARLDRLERDLNTARARAERAGREGGDGFARGFGGGLKSLDSRIGAFTSSLKVGLAGAGISLAAGQLAALGTAVADAGERAQQLQARLQGVTGDAAAFERVKESADKLGLGVGDVADAFGRLGMAGKDLGLSTAEVQKLTETVAMLGKIGGSSAAEVTSGTLQLGQALASGVLQGDELKSILETMPTLARTLAQALGVSTGELRKMGSEGELTAEIVAKALLGAADETARRFAVLGDTGEQAGNRVANAWTGFLAELDKSWNASAFRKDLYAMAAGTLKAATDLVRPETAQDRLGAARDRLSKLGDTSQNGFGAEMARQLRAEIVALEAEVDQAGELARRVAALGAGTPAVAAPKLGASTRPPGTGTRPSRSSGGGGMSEAARQQLDEAEAVETRWLDGLQAREEAEADVAETVRRLTEETAGVQQRAAMAAIAADLEQTSAGRAQLAVMEEELELRERLRDLIESSSDAEREALEEVIKARAEAAGRLAASQERVAAVGDRMNDFQRDMMGLAEGATRDLAHGLLDVARAGEDAADAAKRLVSQLGDRLLSGFIDAGVNALFAPGASATPGGPATDSMALGLFKGIGSMFGFADGGIMTSRGPLALHSYAKGGVASTPQLALFGEGRMAEAFVPLPDGRRIPVDLGGRGGGGESTVNQITVNAPNSADPMLPAKVRYGVAQGLREAETAKAGRYRARMPAGM